eukprot:7616127-Pyramimonas_sp.AAC.1
MCIRDRGREKKKTQRCDTSSTPAQAGPQLPARRLELAPRGLSSARNAHSLACVIMPGSRLRVRLPSDHIVPLPPYLPCPFSKQSSTPSHRPKHSPFRRRPSSAGQTPCTTCPTSNDGAGVGQRTEEQEEEEEEREVEEDEEVMARFRRSGQEAEDI